MSSYVIAVARSRVLRVHVFTNKYYSSAPPQIYFTNAQERISDPSNRIISLLADSPELQFIMSSSNQDNTSTLQSYADSAMGAIHSGIASITGSAGDQANADQAKAKAEAEKDLSHSAAKAGPFTISSSGAPAKDNSDRTEGQYDQTMGSVKEALGNLTGNENLKTQGREQNMQGQGQEAKGQLSDLGQGISDRVGGTVGSAYATLTGNKAAEEVYQQQHVS